ncbi:MAG: PQQ-dependent sugar dehydrogenase [Pirellulaceae bacterium]|nr:PQQ-dependent sugar dehydrogenase [Pirellulaceae bacterium]
MHLPRWISLGVALFAAPLAAADLPQPLVTGLKNPESVCLGPGGAIYLTEIGEFGKDGDGQVTTLKDGKAVPFATGLDDPKGIVAAPEALFVTDKTKVVKIDKEGKIVTLAAADKFPVPPLFLNDIVISPDFNTLYVSDSGDLKGSGGAVYKINAKSGQVETIVNAQSLPGLNAPNGLALDGASFLLLVDFGSGALHRIKLADKTAQKIAEGFDGGDGVTWDKFGRLFISSWKTGKVFGIPRPGQKASELPYQFQQAADSCLDSTGQNVLIPDMKAGTLTAIPTTISGWEVDVSPLPIKSEVAFKGLKWQGFPNEDGVVKALRPILLTHAGDGSGQLYVPTQQGVVHSFANTEEATETRVFMDISDRVRYSDKQNEEGLLGLAFHPKFKENGEFFVFYTDVKAKMANVVSRFRVSKTDPTKGDPASEEELLRFEKPFWNHDGGTIAFGPDGYLYITHGDGGAGGDPHENGQKLSTLLGKVLRIDVDHKSDGKNYAIPKDNPFVGRSDVAPEIWAYGLRNIWRMAFDRQTGQLWAGEVGQNLYEEIIVLKPGGNYGWSLRESLHPFGAKGVDVRSDLIEPIWEYHHDVGKSITGGFVYRGKKLPELAGAYLYADYVTAKVWALWYDEAQGRVVANREIKGPVLPIISFGEDAEGEPYLLTVSETGRGIHRLVKDE